MIFIVYGTTAEYIKLMPLISALKERNSCFTVALSQQETQLADLFRRHPGLPAPDLWLAHGFRGRDLDGFAQVPVWLAKVVAEAVRSWPLIRRVAHPARRANLWLVHGDTFTTVAGAVWGRLMGYTVGHVEAGLRSRHLLHPFPEEINRLLVTRLARLYFAPGPVAARNLAGAAGEIVDTLVNTSHDSLRYARHRAVPALPGLPDRFGIVSLHRTELVGNRRVFARTVRTLAEYGARLPLVFIGHPVTTAAVRREGLDELLAATLIRAPKLDYFAFIGLLDRAAFVITDSGGLQEDCAYLGKPCLLVRRATERTEGIAAGTVTLSHYDDGVLRAFLDDPGPRPATAGPLPARPVGRIIEHLVRHGFVHPDPAGARAPAGEAAVGGPAPC